ncbi:hypothetical protein CR513_38638, partial [Mucuna pruriens]
IIAIVGLQRGIPSKRESSARVDYVPALCTHRPSLLPIEWSGEVFGLRRRGRFAARDVVNLRKDHCRCLTTSSTGEPVHHRTSSIGAGSGELFSNTDPVLPDPSWREAVAPRTSSRQNTNPGASCAKELETVKCNVRGPGDGDPADLATTHNIQNDSRQRISRLLHR